jgi:cytochrome c-type biogenesis protein CcmH/NrfF
VLLWLTPVVLLGLGGLLVFASLRRRASPGPALATEVPELSDGEKRELAAILQTADAAPQAKKRD